VSGGPFLVSSYRRGTSITLVRNTHYYGKPAKLATLIFKVIPDIGDQVRSFRHHHADVLYPDRTALTKSVITRVRSTSHVRTRLAQGQSWEHFDFNLHNTYLRDRALRQALFTALSRKKIIAGTVGRYDSATTALNNRMIMRQQKGYQDNVSRFGLGSGRVTRAKQILTNAGYTGVGTALVSPSHGPVAPLRCRYTVGLAARQRECNIFATAAKKLGVTVHVGSTDDLGATLTHADTTHDYDIVVFAWVASGPFMSSNHDIYTTYAGSNFGFYSNHKVDALLSRAFVAFKRSRQVSLYNQADALISKDAYTLPLYQKPDFLACYQKWGNVRDNGTGQGPPYDAQRWGLRG
jgi:peptide/nickel transport system substrate-binding protein